MRRKIIIILSSLLFSGGAIFGVSQVYAQSMTKPNLVQMIAQKFGLDQAQVQSVFDSFKQQNQANRQQNMQQRLKNKLDQEVSQGKITSAQEQAIIDELNSLHSKYSLSSLKSMAPEQRKQAFQNEQNDLKAWASSQGIDLTLIPGVGMRGMGKGWMMHPKPPA